MLAFFDGARRLVEMLLFESRFLRELPLDYTCEFLPVVLFVLLERLGIFKSSGCSCSLSLDSTKVNWLCSTVSLAVGGLKISLHFWAEL